MNSKIIIAVLVMMLCSSATLAQESREEYKCHLMTNQGDRLLRFSWFPSRADKYMAQLPGTKLADLGFYSGIPLYVKDVLECVRFSERFNSSQARVIDEEMVGQG
ncbi:TapY2 family type IVa secretion system protein [Shewanella violacea]|uniref:Uncharacterized protein n=1 Tax=Shewanella violacea (strain JCM 10179 / CIP 106290 / LMG 19151 / DSS12) TaxID=637905 RepID=D4ZHJ5_SHEVD|nr:TapY2 family type IVa secretion system protein [Shewanella violacea]BAJ01144.1 conserved hypothetical protein [Shewanella violacea DSS12]